MSGNAVQRGSFAITDKYTRARAALLCGVDLVVELPLPFVLSSARGFASGAISLLKAMGCVDGLCFGSESGDIDVLRTLSSRIDDPDVICEMRKELGRGLTFARARQRAVQALYGEETARHIASPNNILAIEYLREMAIQQWPARALTLRRIGARHDSLGASGTVASASFLREKAASLDETAAYYPVKAYQVLCDALQKGIFPADESLLETAVLSHLRRLDKSHLKMLPDLSEGLENRLYKSIRTSQSLEALFGAVKTKRYTLARIRRLILCAFTGVTASDMASPPYVHILGFNKKGSDMLSDMKQLCALPVHTSLAVLERHNAACARFAALETAMGDQYGLILPCARACGYDYSASAVFIK
jgi:predicted nucleotidyltransferase